MPQILRTLCWINQCCHICLFFIIGKFCKLFLETMGGLAYNFFPLNILFLLWAYYYRCTLEPYSQKQKNILGFLPKFKGSNTLLWSLLSQKFWTLFDVGDINTNNFKATHNPYNEFYKLIMPCGTLQIIYYVLKLYDEVN